MESDFDIHLLDFIIIECNYCKQDLNKYRHCNYEKISLYQYYKFTGARWNQLPFVGNHIAIHVIFFLFFFEKRPLASSECYPFKWINQSQYMIDIRGFNFRSYIIEPFLRIQACY